MSFMILLPLLHKPFFPSPFKFLTPSSYFHANFKYNKCFKFFSSEASQIQSDNGRTEFFDRLLQDCIGRTDERSNLDRPLKQIHAQIALTSSLSSAFLSARLVSAYAKCSLLNDARKVFDACPKGCLSNALLWNSVLRAYLSAFRHGAAVELYFRMRELDVRPDGFGFPLIIRACAVRGDVQLCGNVHSHAAQMGLSSNLHVGNALVGMYGEIGLMEAALKVFDRMPLRSRVSWNVMVSGFAKNFDCEGAFGMLCRMENEGWEPNSVTYTSVISSFARCGHGDKTWRFYVLMREKGIDATAESVAVVLSMCDGVPIKGEIVHSHVIRGGFEKYKFVSNALISMYGRNGAVEKAEYLFSGLESKSLVSWNALISAYARSGLCDDAFSAFLRLENSKENPKLRPNVVTWTAVINGFAASEQNKEATLVLFRRMQFAQVKANAVTVASVLASCAELSALPLGREIHSHTIKSSMENDVLVVNALINMYMKCGSLSSGQALFKEMGFKDIISWNIMISGYGMHGFGHEALTMFDQMINAGVKPDEVTFVALLSACSHTGLVNEGRLLFNRMSTEFGVGPRVEHYSCMVDLFGRSGLLEEARRVLKSMQMEPNVHVYGAMLSSSEMKVDDAEESAAKMFDLNSGAMGSYMLLSRIYAENGRWDEAAEVRMLARMKGVRKIPGQSWIEVKKKVFSFSAGRCFGLDMEELCLVLQDLKLQMVMESSLPRGLFEVT